MMAGHTMLKVFGGFVVLNTRLGAYISVLENSSCIFTSLCFAILTVYLNDALNLHH